MHRSVAVLTSTLAAVLCLAGALSTARAADSEPAAGTPEQIIAHHFATFASGDLDAVMSDYADDAVLITAAGVAHGKAAIRAQFAQLVQAPRAGTPAPQRQRGPDIIEKHFTPNVAWLMWVQNRGKPNELRGVETYLIRGGKIHLETVGTVSVHPAATASTGRQ
jgi:ketosteroid isomerase-like protein